MEFSNNKPIYRQIIDYTFARILDGSWAPGERIPSVRELAVSLSVNTHTVLKALEYLQAHDIIVPRRGMGYYLTDDARQYVDRSRREEFFTEILPDVIRQMRSLGITIDEVIAHSNDLDR